MKDVTKWGWLGAIWMTLILLGGMVIAFLVIDMGFRLAAVCGL